MLYLEQDCVILCYICLKIKSVFIKLGLTSQLRLIVVINSYNSLKSMNVYVSETKADAQI